MLPLMFAVATATVSLPSSTTPVVHTATIATDRPVRAPQPADEPREQLAPTPQPTKEVFGDPGQFVVEGGFGLSVQSRLDTDNQTQVNVAPRFGWFFAKNMALQVELGYLSQKSGSATAQALSIGAGIHTNVWMNENVSLYPGAELGVVNAWLTRTNSSGANDSVTVFQLAMHLPLLYHATTHVFFGGGVHLTLLQPTEARQKGAATFSFTGLVGVWL